MDSFDFFRQLTKGAKFSKKNITNTHVPGELKQKPLLKKEEKLIQEDTTEDIGGHDAELTPDKAFETDIKMEEVDLESDSEEATFEFIKGGGAVSAKRKKRKKQLTPAEHEKQLEEEMLRILRKEQRITVQGKQIPAPIVSFEELRVQYNVSEQLVKNLLALHYPQPTPIQMQAIPIMLQGRPLMACAPTGSGKTLAFLTPIINDLRTPKRVGFRAMVLAPTRELAQQIYRECVRLSEKTTLHIHFISKVSQSKQKLGPDGNNKCDILISTPNRIRYLLQQEPPLLNLKSVEWFVLDEADRLMEDGQNNFKEQLEEILAACTNPNKKLALFSATYTASVGKWAMKNLKNLARVNVGFQNAATETVEQELRFVGAESGKILEIRNLVHAGLQPPVLVFVQSKERAKQLFEELLFDGVNVDIIHADRTQQQRDNCVRAFREGHIWVLICTELMGRGIDFKGVNLVINFDFPPSTISYIHRIGRTGRAGRPGRAITFYTQDDMQYLRSIAQIVHNSGGKVPDHMLHMRKMRKTETRKLANRAPKREDITTQLKPEPASRKKLMQMERMFKKQLAKAEEAADTDRLTKKLKKVQQQLQMLQSTTQSGKTQLKSGVRKKRKTKEKPHSEDD